MRMIVIAFAILAGLKVWTQDRFVRAALSEALVQVHRERAQQLCQKEAAKPGKPVPQWASVPAEVTIGNADTNVALWDFDNPLWDVRYRHPHLVLPATGTSSTRCSYDLVAGLARISVR
jgi:hypothetical protein